MPARRKTIWLGGWQHWLWALVSLPTCRSTPVIGKHVDWSFSQGCRDACCRQASLFYPAQPHAAPARLHAAREVDVRRAPAPAASSVPGPGVGTHHPRALIGHKKMLSTVDFPSPRASLLQSRAWCRRYVASEPRHRSGRGRRPELSPTGMRRCGGCRHEYLSYDQSDRLLRPQHRLGIGQHCKVCASSALQG